MEDVTAQPAKRNYTPYLIGAFLSYVFCVVTFGRAFGAGADWHLSVAATGALCFWPFFAILYFAAQILLRWTVGLIWKMPKTHAVLVLNAPIAILIALTGISAVKEPEAAFRHFLANPILKSVRITEFGRTQAIGEPMSLRLAFEIQLDDLGVLLRNGGYVWTNDFSEDNRPTFGWLRKDGGAGGKLDLNDPLHHYVSTNDPSLNLYIRWNDSNAYFLYAKPYH